MNLLSARLVGYGVLLGTVGVKILTSDDAKKLYTHCTAAAMRGVDEVAKEAKMIADAKAFLESCEEKDA